MHRERRRYVMGAWGLSAAVVAGFLFPVLTASPALAATQVITVTGTGDAGGSCSGNSCPTLRTAVALANTLTSSVSSPLEIDLPTGTITLTGGVMTIGSATNLFVTVKGATAGSPSGSVIDQSTSNGVFITPGTSANAVVNLTDLTIENAHAGGFGGGALQAGAVSLTATGEATTITDCAFLNNTATKGGAIVFASGGDLTVINSTFTNNSATVGTGGAIDFFTDGGHGASALSISGSTFTGNSITGAVNGGANGGAVFYNGGGTSSLTVTTSLFSGNSAGSATGAGGEGAGLLINENNGNTDSVTLSTFVNNTAHDGAATNAIPQGEGGGIWTNGGTLTLSDSRLVGNSATDGPSLWQNTNGGSANAIHNWWGVNTGPGSNVGGGTGAVITTSPWLQLRNIASPSTVLPGGQTTFTADLLGLSTGGALAAGSLNGLAPFPATGGVFSNPVDGTLSSTATQFVNGVATTNLTAGSTLGTNAAEVNATADNQTVTGGVNVKANSTTAVSTSLTPTVFGQGVQFTATLTSNTPGTTPSVPEGGTVQFQDGGTNLGSAVSVTNGSATTPTITSLSVGLHTITAVYSGDSDFNGSTGTLTGGQTVNKANTSVAVGSIPNPSVVTHSVTLSATITATPPGAGTPGGTGSVQFEDNGSPLGAAQTPVNGVAMLSVSTLAVGTHPITAVYAGDGNFNGSTSSPAVVQTVEPQPPSISKSFGAATIPLGGSTSLSFTVTNPAGNGTQGGNAFTDTLPSGLVVSIPNGESGTCGGGTITATAGSSSVSLSGASLADGATCTISVNVTGTTAGVQNNSVTVSSTNGGTGNTAMASVTVVAPPTLTKSFGAAMVAVNGSTSLTFTVANPNAGTTLTGVGFLDIFPSGLVVATPNGQSGTCGGGTITATAGTGSVTLGGASLAAGTSCMFSVNVKGSAAGSQVNTTSTVSSNEGGAGAAATATVMVTPAPPSISKSFGAPSIPVGSSTSLSFTVTNPAGNGTQGGNAFTDSLPSGLVVATPNGESGTCGGGTITATAGSGTVSLSGASLADGGTCTFSVNVTGTTAGVQSNSVTVSSTNGGTGNTATASVTVVAPPTLSKSFLPTTIALNGTSTLSFTVTNPNTGTALSGIGFTDPLSTGLVVSTPNALTGSCGGGTITATAGGSSITLTGASLAAMANCTFSLSVTGTMAGEYTNTTSAPTSIEGGSGTAATATLNVMSGPPMIAKSFGAATIPLGGSTTLSFTVTNSMANGTSTGIGFTDTLPSGLVVSTPNGATGSCGGGTITAAGGSGSVSLSGATLSGGGSCTFSVSVTGSTAGVKNNSVTVSSTSGGTGNTATASVTVVAPPTVSKSFGAPSVPLGSTTSLSFTIANPNATVALSGVGLTDTLPAGLVVATPNGLTGSCGSGTVTATAGSSSVTLSGGSIVAGGSCMFSVTVTGTQAGSWQNTTG
ncbi:MAG: beta strand repeat-containing protein, partial [Acidimicrobiales bacterium]